MILLIWKREKYYYQEASNNYLFCMPMCTVTCKSIRILNCNEIHFIRKFWFYWKFVRVYLNAFRVYLNAAGYLFEKIYEINPKSSKIFSILDTIIIITYFDHNIFNITKYLKTKNYWNFNFISLKWYLHINFNLFNYCNV